MSKIVLGIGTSHSPMLAMSPAMWLERSRDDERRKSYPLADGRVVDFAQLARESGNRYAAQATLENFQRQHDTAQRELDRLAQALADAAPDLVIVVGDDQDELFKLQHMPAVALYHGDQIVMHPKAEVQPDLPAWHREALRGYSQDRAHRHQGAPDVALRLIDALLDRDVDIGAAAQVLDPLSAGFGHAFGFVMERLMRGRKVPVLPLLLNTYFPPNVLRPGRCHAVGRLLREAIEAQDDDLRIAIVASGGLSHFATDEVLDRRVLDALRTADAAALGALPPLALRSGTSEILCWVLAGGAWAGLPCAWQEYLPVYRTAAGSGVGLAFACWRD